MIDDFHILAPCSLVREEKHRLLLKELKCLTETHRCNCKEYANYLDAIGFCSDKVTAIEDIPYLPIRAFKELELKSISDDDVFKIMTSSGTSGQKKSRIFYKNRKKRNEKPQNGDKISINCVKIKHVHNILLVVDMREK